MKVNGGVLSRPTHKYVASLLVRRSSPSLTKVSVAERELRPHHWANQSGTDTCRDPTPRVLPLLVPTDQYPNRHHGNGRPTNSRTSELSRDSFEVRNWLLSISGWFQPIPRLDPCPPNPPRPKFSLNSFLKDPGRTTEFRH